MSNGNSESLLDRAKFFREHIQTILSLATGSLLLSITFLHNIEPKAQHVENLKRSWEIFVLSIVFGLLYNYVLSIYVANEGKKYGGVLRVLSFLFHLSFVGAVFFMLRFGTANL